MKDKLKERVDNNQMEWDHYETNLEELWENIEAQLDERENRRTGFNSRFWFKVAASIALLFVISWGIMSSSELNSTSSELYGLRDISPELAETEYYYASKINEKITDDSHQQCRCEQFGKGRLEFIGQCLL